MLPGWMPDERQLGYDVMNIGGGQRILAHAIEQKLTLTSSGAYEMLVEGSTKPVAQNQDACRDRARAALQLHHGMTWQRRVFGVKRKRWAQFEVYRV